MSEETSPGEKLTVVRLADKEAVQQLCARARQAILAWLRDRSEYVFWRNSVSLKSSYYDFGRFLGIARAEKLNLPSVARVLPHHSPLKFRAFEAHFDATENREPSFCVNLTGSSEWTDVATEAWEGLQRPAQNLSESAAKLLSWAQMERNQEAWISRATIGRQAQLRGTSWTADYLDRLFKEILAKTSLGMHVEKKEDEFRTTFKPIPPAEPAPARHGPLNPVLTVDFKEVRFAELDRFSEMVYHWILAADLPSDSAPLAVWLVNDRATLFRCFPSWQQEKWETSTLVSFLGQMALDHGLSWGYSFQDPKPWLYECGPRQGLTWGDVKASIRQASSLPPLAERYGISSEAAALVRWFLTLRAKEWFGNLTPSLEGHLKTRIGIATDWSDKNLAVYFSILAEEISERTDWKVTVHPWSDGWTGVTHRLLVKRKPTELQNIVHQIKVLAVSQGKMLSPDRIEAALRPLWN